MATHPTKSAPKTKAARMARVRATGTNSSRILSPTHFADVYSRSPAERIALVKRGVSAGDVFKILTEDCDLHTVLRLPNGTFTPYSPGTKTNVIFFTEGYPTETIWVYDARTNVPRITKKDRPLTPQHFAGFETCFGKDPNGHAKRASNDSKEDRWHTFTIAEVKEHDFKIDSLKWLKDESLDDMDELPEPEELATDAISELESAVEELSAIIRILENNNESLNSLVNKTK